MSGMLQLLRLVTVLRQVEGRKKLQKIVHILKSLGHEFPQHFGYLHYGPYSSGLAAEVDSLVSGQLVAEARGAEDFSPYVYSASPAAANLLNELGQSTLPAWHALAQELNAKDANELEAISTLFYLNTNGFAGEALQARFIELKPNLKHLVQVATTTVESLKERSFHNQTA